MNIETQDIQKAIYALHFIPASCTRDTWVKVGMAAKDAGISFDIFDSWSAQGNNYQAKDCASAWKSFKEGKGVGAGTLFSIAKSHGWSQNRQWPMPERQRSFTGMRPEEVLKRCTPVPDTHPYITAKNAHGVPLNGLGVIANGVPLRINGNPLSGALVIPGYGFDGALQTLQFIPTEGGKKLNLPGVPMSGASFTVGHIVNGQPIYLCEGIGTAWAVWIAVKRPAVVCFGWGNVAHIAQQLHHKYPLCALVLCPDVGKEDAARTISKSVNGAIVTLPMGYAQNTDLCDYAQQKGHAALAQLLNSAHFDAPVITETTFPLYLKNLTKILPQKIKKNQTRTATPHVPILHAYMG